MFKTSSGDGGSTERRCPHGYGAPAVDAIVVHGYRKRTCVRRHHALLDEGTLAVRPFPLALGNRPGAIPILARVCPEVTSLAAHRREDGRHVRYLVPPIGRRFATDDARPCALVDLSALSGERADRVEGDRAVGCATPSASGVHVAAAASRRNACRGPRSLDAQSRVLRVADELTRRRRRGCPAVLRSVGSPAAAGSPVDWPLCWCTLTLVEILRERAGT
jgi:hypothetical protein